SNQHNVVIAVTRRCELWIKFIAQHSLCAVVHTRAVLAEVDIRKLDGCRRRRRRRRRRSCDFGRDVTNLYVLRISRNATTLVRDFQRYGYGLALLPLNRVAEGKTRTVKIR